MTVYIVICDEYSEPCISGVFLDEEKAEVAAYLRDGYVKECDTEDDEVQYNKDDVLYSYRIFTAADGITRASFDGVLLKARQLKKKNLAENVVIIKEKNPEMAIKVYAEGLLRRLSLEKENS